jgi:hypothetical protein
VISWLGVLQIEKLKNKLHHQLLKDKKDKAQAKLKKKKNKRKSQKAHKFNSHKTKANKTKRIYKNKKTKSYKSKSNTLFMKTTIIEIELLRKNSDISIKFKIKS